MLTSTPRSTSLPAEIRVARRFGAAMGGRSARSSSFFNGNAEPSLEDLMADPIMHRLMARDGVALDSLNSLIDEVRGRLL